MGVQNESLKSIISINLFKGFWIALFNSGYLLLGDFLKKAFLAPEKRLHSDKNPGICGQDIGLIHTLYNGRLYRKQNGDH